MDVSISIALIVVSRVIQEERMVDGECVLTSGLAGLPNTHVYVQE
jgi:hypothetical protein